MKPELRMEGEKPSVITFPDTTVAAPEKPEKKGWSTPKKITVGVVIGLVSLVVIAAVVIISVYYGTKLSQDSFKTAKQTFMTGNGKITNEETEVSKNDVDVKIPDAMEVVYDYKYGLVVVRYNDKETKTRSPCFARYMNVSQAPSREATDYNGDGQISLDEQQGASETKEEWVSTDRRVPRYLISEAVDKMCRDTEIYWLEQTQTNAVSKRSITYIRTQAHYCIKTTLACQYKCYVTLVYYDDVKLLYYYITGWRNYCDTTCAHLYSYC